MFLCFKSNIYAIAYIFAHFKERRDVPMTRDDWIIHIENVAGKVTVLCDNKTVQFVLAQFNAVSISDLPDSSLQDFYNELFSYIENAC